MKKINFLFYIIIIFIFIIFLFSFSNKITSSILFSFNLWKENIFPSLFPFFVISNILINIGFVDFISDIFERVFHKLFLSTKYSTFIFFMSMLSGFPSSGKYLNDLLDKGKIDNEEANKILLFTFFSNPLFIINTIGISFYNNKKIGFIILISHYLGNIIIGFLFRKYKYKKIKVEKLNIKKTINNFNTKINNTKILSVLFESIISSLKSLINVFATITFFLIILTILVNIFNLSEPYNSLFSGLIEMTSGLKYLNMTTLSLKLKIVISTFFISFGGLSIHGQILSILKEHNINYPIFLLSRIIHGLISCSIVFILSIKIIH